MGATTTADITDLLSSWSGGDEASGEEALAALYGELRGLAGGYLALERASHTLGPTGLVHEAYLRLHSQLVDGWRDREHFMACAAQAMHRVLVDHARKSRAKIRGGSWQRVDLDCAIELALERPGDLLALDDALGDLAGLDERKAKIVELRFFAGLSCAQIARCLGCSRPTVVRHWRLARLWLFRQLTADSQGAES